MPMADDDVQYLVRNKVPAIFDRLLKQLADAPRPLPADPAKFFYESLLRDTKPVSVQTFNFQHTFQFNCPIEKLNAVINFDKLATACGGSIVMQSSSSSSPALANDDECRSSDEAKQRQMPASLVPLPPPQQPNSKLKKPNTDTFFVTEQLIRTVPNGFYYRMTNPKDLPIASLCASMLTKTVSASTAQLTWTVEAEVLSYPKQHPSSLCEGGGMCKISDSIVSSVSAAVMSLLSNSTTASGSTNVTGKTIEGTWQHQQWKHDFTFKNVTQEKLDSVVTFSKMGTGVGGTLLSDGKERRMTVVGPMIPHQGNNSNKQQFVVEQKERITSNGYYYHMADVGPLPFKNFNASCLTTKSEQNPTEDSVMTWTCSSYIDISKWTVHQWICYLEYWVSAFDKMFHSLLYPPLWQQQQYTHVFSFANITQDRLNQVVTFNQMAIGVGGTLINGGKERKMPLPAPWTPQVVVEELDRTVFNGYYYHMADTGPLPFKNYNASCLAKRSDTNPETDSYMTWTVSSSLDTTQWTSKQWYSFLDSASAGFQQAFNRELYSSLAAAAWQPQQYVHTFEFPNIALEALNKVVTFSKMATGIGGTVVDGGKERKMPLARPWTGKFVIEELERVVSNGYYYHMADAGPLPFKNYNASCLTRTSETKPDNALLVWMVSSEVNSSVWTSEQWYSFLDGASAGFLHAFNQDLYPPSTNAHWPQQQYTYIFDFPAVPQERLDQVVSFSNMASLIGGTVISGGKERKMPLPAPWAPQSVIEALVGQIPSGYYYHMAETGPLPFKNYNASCLTKRSTTNPDEDSTMIWEVSSEMDNMQWKVSQWYSFLEGASAGFQKGLNKQLYPQPVLDRWQPQHYTHTFTFKDVPLPKLNQVVTFSKMAASIHGTVIDEGKKRKMPLPAPWAPQFVVEELTGVVTAGYYYHMADVGPLPFKNYNASCLTAKSDSDPDDSMMTWTVSSEMDTSKWKAEQWTSFLDGASAAFQKAFDQELHPT
eukprot:TRINITY_DN57701_c0_g1_i1.p1 TRINITY_DN57701_c0_g1~~TRINITY_DN57701_c0_g1_i1.p1  ORF type:complete len:992 (-),score=102.76 TRINITY_DN57701_c0_g1_i1:82-3057(-)